MMKTLTAIFLSFSLYDHWSGFRLFFVRAGFVSFLFSTMPVFSRGFFIFAETSRPLTQEIRLF